MSSDDVPVSFDVFISYSHKDAEWVRDWLVSRLRKEGVSVCIDEECFDIGVPALVNMRNAVAASRCTLIVLTRDWVKSEWTLFESLVAQHKDPAGLRQRILPLLREECEVPDNFDFLTRADFTGKGNADNEFAKLLDAIRGKRRLPDQRRKPENKIDRTEDDKDVNRSRTLASLPRPPVVGFVARSDKEGRNIVEMLKEELAPQKSQLVALWGDGGFGKTTIAAEAAREMIEVFDGRLVWTSADGRPDFALSTLLDEIATQLGEPEMRKLALEPKKEAVRELIAQSETPTLVVLDNFETISPEEQKKCAEWIAKHAPCPALITTRGRVNGARNVPIKVMSQQEANEFLDRRITQAQNSRAFERLDRDRIIEAAQANPLVMQWVIAQIDLAEHPNDVLDDLAHGEGDAAQRVFDRSFNLPQLGDDGRDTLLALSLFAPDASRDALAEVAGFNNNVRRLREAAKSLAALCLVETTGAGERLVIKGLTRDLARARLSKDERVDDFRRRFVVYFLRYAESHSKTTKEDFDALEAEKDNVLGAIDVAFEMKDWESLIGMMGAIGSNANGFLSLRGYWDDLIRRTEQALEAATEAKAQWHLGAFANDLGAIKAKRGEYTQAKEYYERAIEVARKLDAQQGLSTTLRQLGILAENQRELEEARQFYNESLKIDKKLNNPRGIALTTWGLGNLALLQGDLVEARKQFMESLKTFESLHDQHYVAGVLNQLGILAENQRELEEARQFYNESLKIKRTLGDQRGIGTTLARLGLLAEREGKYAEATRLFHEALTIFEKLGSRYAESARRDMERVRSKI